MARDQTHVGHRMHRVAQSRFRAGLAGAIRVLLSLLVVAGVVVVVSLVVSRAYDDPKHSVPQALALSPQPVSYGPLTRTTKATGRMQFSDSMTIRHRIAGQLAVAPSGSASDTQAERRAQSAQSGGAPRALHPVSAWRGATFDTTTTTSVEEAIPTTTPGRGGGGAPRSGGFGRTGGTASTVPPRIQQIVTSIVPVGSEVSLGDVLYTIESRPVVLLYGTLPAWRTLSISVSDGPDVRQLEQSLVELGYDREGAVLIDHHFDEATEAMVRRWQIGLGGVGSGAVALGSVVFVQRPSTVGSVLRSVGDAVGDADGMLTLTGTTQRIVIDVPSEVQEYFRPGLPVRLSPGDTGTVEYLRVVNRDSTPVVQAVIVPTSRVETARNGASVMVTADIEVASDVFIVPAQAVVSRLDGAYYVQVVAPETTMDRQPFDATAVVSASIWVRVELVAVAGSKVGIRPVDDTASSLVEGTEVLTPAA